MDAQEIHKNLLEFENQKEVLDFKFNSVKEHIWPFVRYSLFSDTLSRELGLERSINYVKNTGFTRFQQIVKDLYLAIVLNPFMTRHQHEILFFSWTSNTTGIKDGNRYFNKRDDYFAGIFPNNTSQYEQSINGIFRYPRHSTHVYSRDIINYISTFTRKIIRSKKEDRHEVEKFLDFLRSRYPYDIDAKFISTMKAYLLNLPTRVRVHRYLYSKILNINQPKLVIIQNATYGMTGYLVKLVKEHGIRVGEFQHGTITRGHIGFNYGENIANSNLYRQYVPDYLFTYGKYWNMQNNSSSKNIIIGNPHITKMTKIKQAIRKDEDGKKTLVVVSQWAIAEQISQFTLKVSELMLHRNWNIVLRLHPADRSDREIYKKIKLRSNIRIDEDMDIYNLFDIADCVFGCFSTVLYEAVAFRKQVYILSNEMSKRYIDSKLGVWVHTPNELVEMLNKGNDIEDPSYYWDDNWEHNYRNFIESEILTK